MNISTTNSQLGKMALNAAIAIERNQRHESTDVSDVNRFLDAVSDQLEPGAANLRDESMFPYYSFAFAKANLDESPTRGQFASLLRNALQKHKDATAEGDQLEHVKLFCLAFHEAMVRASQSRFSKNNRFDGRIR